MNTMTDMRNTTAIAASGLPLAADRYRTGGVVLAQTDLVLTGAVCPQTTSPITLGNAWGGGRSSASVQLEAGRPASVRPSSDFTKPRYGSQASDGSG